MIVSYRDISMEICLKSWHECLVTPLVGTVYRVRRLFSLSQKHQINKVINISFVASTSLIHGWYTVILQQQYFICCVNSRVKCHRYLQAHTFTVLFRGCKSYFCSNPDCREGGSDAPDRSCWSIRTARDPNILCSDLPWKCGWPGLKTTHTPGNKAHS